LHLRTCSYQQISRNLSPIAEPALPGIARRYGQLGYLASYTDRGRFYTLSEMARFDPR